MEITYIPASSLRLIELFISNAFAVRATYSFLYVDHGLSQSLRFLPKGSQVRGTRLDTSQSSKTLKASVDPGTIYAKIFFKFEKIRCNFRINPR